MVTYLSKRLLIVSKEFSLKQHVDVIINDHLFKQTVLIIS